MSSVIYGAVTRKRDEAPRDDSTKASPPGVKTYVDALAALVPAEVLAFHAIMLQATTETKKVNGQSQTTITDPTTLKWVFAGCIVLSAGLFAFGRVVTAKRKWEGLDWVRLLIPAGAFVLWTIIQKSTAWDAVSPDSLSEGGRLAIGAGGAIVLGALAAILGIQLNKQGEPPAG